MVNSKDSIARLKRSFIIALLLSLVLFVLAVPTFIHGYNLVKKPILAVLLLHDVKKTTNESWVITQDSFDKLFKSFRYNKYKFIEPKDFNSLYTSGFTGRNLMVTFDDGTQDEYEAIKYLYDKYSIKSVLFLIEDFIDKPNNMSLAQIKELKEKYGTVLGIHGQYHEAYTTQLKNGVDLGLKTEEARIKLNKLFNTNIEWLAYPYGEYNEEVIKEISSKVAISKAFTIESGLINSQENKLLQLPRFMYLGGTEPDGIDKDLQKSLLPPNTAVEGQLYMALSLMVLFFGISRLLITWKYYKALAILNINKLK